MDNYNEYDNRDTNTALSKEARERYALLLRIVEANIFLEEFYSDWIHMYDNIKKRWIADPPDYECIMDRWRGGDGGRRRWNCDGSNKDDHIYNLDEYITIAG